MIVPIIIGVIGRCKSVSQQSTFKTDDGDIVKQPDKISNSFNYFFINIGTKLASDIKHSGKDYFKYILNPTQTSLFMKPIIAEEIVKIISKFNQNKSPGHDGIGNNNLLNEKQFGFRPNHFTYKAIIELLNKIDNAVERNETTVGIFLDLSKAFDTINHDILLYKLEYYGFRGVALDWFKSYLSNRKQFVRYEMHDSNHKIINCGVPQGSILGPLLFILYINDIVNTTSLLELILFADDTTLLFSHQDIASQNDIINNELQEICNWFQANKLSVNASKTNYMVLGTHHSTRKFIDINQDIDILTDSESSGSRNEEKVKLNIKLNGVSLNRVSSTKFLGVIIDET